MTKQDGKTQPCPHMKGLLSSYADETLTGISRWYTRLHLSGCPQCTKVLEELLQMLKQLRTLKSAPDVADINALVFSDTQTKEKEKMWEKAFDAIDRELEDKKEVK
jgi:hypothetical protein